MARGSGQDNNSSMRSKKANGKGRWSLEEHGRFLEGVRMYGKNWDAIRALVPTRTAMQIRTHYSPKYATRKLKGPAPHDEAYDANTAVRGGLSAESQADQAGECRLPKQPAASSLEANLKAANVRKADLLGPSFLVQAQTPHAHGTYAGMNSITRTQQLRSTQHGDKPWMVASTSGARSGAMKAGPSPDKYGRLTSRSYLPAPPLMPTFNEAASRRHGPESTPAAIQTAPAMYGGRSSVHGAGRGYANAGYGISRSKFELPDEDSSGMTTSVDRPVGRPSQAWRVCKPECAPRMTKVTEGTDGILECFFGADIFGVL